MPIQKVEPGQIWADTDKRRKGRRIRIDRIEASHVYGTVVTNTQDVTIHLLDCQPSCPVNRIGTKTRLSIARMWNGEYSLVDERAETTAEAPAETNTEPNWVGFQRYRESTTPEAPKPVMHAVAKPQAHEAEIITLPGLCVAADDHDWKPISVAKQWQATVGIVYLVCNRCFAHTRRPSRYVVSA